MVKISPYTIKEAAKNVNELMETSSPEIKMLLENPHFATGLCLVLHKEVVQLRNQIQEMQSSSSQARQVEQQNFKQSRQDTSQGQREAKISGPVEQPKSRQEESQQPEKEELFV